MTIAPGSVCLCWPGALSSSFLFRWARTSTSHPKPTPPSRSGFPTITASNSCMLPVLALRRVTTRNPLTCSQLELLRALPARQAFDFRQSSLYLLRSKGAEAVCEVPGLAPPFVSFVLSSIPPAFPVLRVPQFLNARSVPEVYIGKQKVPIPAAWCEHVRTCAN